MAYISKQVKFMIHYRITIRDPDKNWRSSIPANSEFEALKKALDKFGSPELQQVLTKSGLGNHPAVIRLLLRAGKAISEDTIIGGDAPSNAAKSHADVLYPDNN